MRKLVLLGAAAVLTVSAGTAAAHGPAGSSETVDNKVTCAGPVNAGGGSFYAGANGVETCGPNGRIIVAVDGGSSYVGTDGTKENPEPAQMWVRVDSGGPECGDGDISHDSGSIQECAG